LAVANGGTGLTSGTSGGILGFTGTSTLASSGLLTANAIMLGGGAGATPTTLGSLGTTTTVLHGNASGAPSFSAITSSDFASGSVGTIISVASDGSFSNGTHFINSSHDDTIEDRISIPMPANCTAKKLYYKASGDLALVSGDSLVVTLRKNSADTALTCSLVGPTSADSCNDTVNTVSFTAGDLWTIQLVGVGAASQYHKVGFQCAI
jgi:hypothetical protein